MIAGVDPSPLAAIASYPRNDRQQESALVYKYMINVRSHSGLAVL
jgi:hypothetical protein